MKVEWLAFPDVHGEGVHEKAFACMVRAAKILQPKNLICLGDFLDCYRLSRHLKRPHVGMATPDEFRVGNKLLDRLDAIQSPKKWYLKGNHEQRVDDYIARQAPDLAGLLSVPGALHLEERGWTYKRYQEHITLGRINFVHDVGFCGKYALNQTLTRFGGSVVIGHVHRAGMVYEGDCRGRSHVAVCPGWLGDPDYPVFDYMAPVARRREWMHGFTYGVNDGRGNTHVTLVPIIDGKAVVNGSIV